MWGCVANPSSDMEFLLAFCGFFTLTLYLFYRSARLLLNRRYRAALLNILASVASASLILYFGALFWYPMEDKSVITDSVVHSVFHIEIWPWVIPIVALAVGFFWLAGLSLRAFKAQSYWWGLVFSAAGMLSLVPLTYMLFIVWVFVLFSGPPKTESELIADFEINTGLTYPASATLKRYRSGRSDAFGDWHGGLVFEVPMDLIAQYHTLPPERWGDGTRWEVWDETICCDPVLERHPRFHPPAGARFMSHEDGLYMFVAVMHETATIYYVRASW